MADLVASCQCGRTYTTEQWRALPFTGYQTAGPDDEGPLTVTELRDCHCGSTLGRDQGLGETLTRHELRLEALERAS